MKTLPMTDDFEFYNEEYYAAVKAALDEVRSHFFKPVIHQRPDGGFFIDVDFLNPHIPYGYDVNEMVEVSSRQANEFALSIFNDEDLIDDAVNKKNTDEEQQALWLKNGLEIISEKIFGFENLHHDEYVNMLSNALAQNNISIGNLDKFENYKDYLELACDAIYGKTIQSVIAQYVDNDIIRVEWQLKLIAEQRKTLVCL